MSDLKTVKAEVTIAGKLCHCVYIRLHQSFNSHHKFELKVDFDQLDTFWMFNPISIIQLIGKDVEIILIQRNSSDSVMFKGIITNVSMNGNHGQQNYYTITGCSSTILLDGTQTMDSFVDLDLKSIVDEAVKQSGNGGEVTANPVFNGKIDYISQYNETCFEFLNRLSWLYGEFFFYDGTTIHFGKPDLGDVSLITYDVDMTYFDLNANLIPPKVKRFDYLNHIDNPVKLDTPDTVSGVRGYIKAALDESTKVYNSEANIPLSASIQNMKELEDMVKVDKYRMISQMLIMKGSTHSCKVKIGKLISVNLPSSMKDVPLKHVETFLVTDVTHEIDQNERYSNSFTAIPSEMESIPMKSVQSPYAFPQVAWVKSNADDKGRVKVQMQWQELLNKTTNWIRVQTPDSGKSDKVANNRGFVFIPEEDDLVMVNFENGDPNRPYVSGSIFTENVSKGGGQGNKSKSLTTRSGSTVTLDDEKGSVLIADQTGEDSITIDGTNKITIKTTKTIELNNGQSSITMTDDTIVISSGKITIGGTDFVRLNSGAAEASVTSEGGVAKTAGTTNLVSSTTKTSVTSDASVHMQAPAITENGTTSVDITGGLVKINS